MVVDSPDSDHLFTSLTNMEVSVSDLVTTSGVELRMDDMDMSTPTLTMAEMLKEKSASHAMWHPKVKSVPISAPPPKDRSVFWLA